MIKGFLFIALILFAGISHAQDLFNMLAPESPATVFDIDGSFAPQSEIDHSGKQTHVFNQNINFSQRVYEGEKNRVSIGAKYNKLDITNGPGVNDFYDEQVSINWRHLLPDQRFVLYNASFGSASDRPFKNNRDNTIGANIIYKYDSKWFIVGNYSNNRIFLNNIPLPGAFYVAEASQFRKLIVGFPFVIWMRPISEKWSLRYIGFIPWSHKLRFLYNGFKTFRPYVGLEQNPQTYFNHDREERYDRLFWFERRLITGIEGDLTKSLKYDLGGGYAFDRQFFEARNFQQDKNFLINLEASWFVGLGLKFKM
jgi:hypothetical protein